MDVDADMHVEDLVAGYPKAIGFLAERGVVCIRCGEPYWGTLRELATTKGLGDQVDEIVQDLQRYLDGLTPDS
jgi:hypothetical protein